MTIILKDILNGEVKEVIDNKILDLRSKINTFKISDIARPTSVKDVSGYTDITREPFTSKLKGTPAHVKAAINYNDFLKFKKLEMKYAPITDGQKVKWVYLVENNPYHIEEMAFRDNGEDPKEILEFIEQYIDRKKIYETELVMKITDFYQALSWGNIPTNVNRNASKFF